MNKVILVGRLCRDPEVRNAQGEGNNAVARFTVAASRRYKNAEGNYDADFPNCVAFGKTAEFISKYFKKGMMIGITGRLTTGSYVNKDGVKVYTTDVTVEEAEFAESKNSNSSEQSSDTYSRDNTSSISSRDDDFLASLDDDDLPFS